METLGTGQEMAEAQPRLIAETVFQIGSSAPFAEAGNTVGYLSQYSRSPSVVRHSKLFFMSSSTKYR